MVLSKRGHYAALLLRGGTWTRPAQPLYTAPPFHMHMRGVRAHRWNDAAAGAAEEVQRTRGALTSVGANLAKLAAAVAADEAHVAALQRQQVRWCGGEDPTPITAHLACGPHSVCCAPQPYRGWRKPSWS